MENRSPHKDGVEDHQRLSPAKKAVRDRIKKLFNTLSRSISPAHITRLANEGISERFALEAGVHTVIDADDLPESLQWAAKNAPLLVFEHVGIDEEVVVTQVRFDDDSIPDGCQKYMQESGTGGVASIHPSRRHLVGKAKKVAVVEGSKDAMGVAEHAPSDVMVVGMQGINGYMTGGMPAPWVAEVVDTADEVVIFADKDVETNRDVWLAVERLADYLKMIGIKKVVVARLPVDGKNSISDLLGRTAPEKRTTVVEGAITGARALKTIKATAPKAKVKEVSASDALNDSPVVDWDACEIRMPDTYMEIPNSAPIKVPGKRLAACAYGIKRRIVSRDDLAGGKQNVTNDITVKTAEWTHEVKDIPSASLGQIGEILEQIPHGLGEEVDWARDIRGVKEVIERAVRSDTTLDTVTIVQFQRTGLIEDASGEPAFLLPKGAIGVTGLQPNLRGVPDDAKYHGIDLPDPTNISDEDAAKFARSVRTVIEQFEDRTVIYALFGSFFFAPMGLRPATSLAAIGLPGSGKTTAIRAVAGLYGARYWESPHHTFEGTTNSIRATGAGMENLCAVCDDLKPAQSENDRARMLAGYQTLARVGYEGGEAGRERMIYNKDTGKTVSAGTDKSNPFIIIGSEPSGFPTAETHASTVERGLTVGVEYETSIIGGGMPVLTDVCTNGSMPATYALYLRHLMRLIDTNGGINTWKELQAKKRVDVQNALRKGDKELTARAAEVAAPYLMGIGSMLDFLLEVGGITKAQFAEMGVEATTLIVAATSSHSADRLGGVLSGSAAALETLRGAISGGDFTQSSGDGHEGLYVKPVLCEVKYLTDPKTKKSMRVVVINPEVAKKPLGVSASRVGTTLRGQTIANGQGRYGWSQSINGYTLRNALVIPYEIFWPTTEEGVL